MLEGAVSIYVISLTSPMRGRGYSTPSVCVCVCVCLSVCYRSSGRHAYSTGPTKVSKESARHKDHNTLRSLLIAGTNFSVFEILVFGGY